MLPSPLSKHRVTHSALSSKQSLPKATALLWNTFGVVELFYVCTQAPGGRIWPNHFKKTELLEIKT